MSDSASCEDSQSRQPLGKGAVVSHGEHVSSQSTRKTTVSLKLFVIVVAIFLLVILGLALGLGLGLGLEVRRLRHSIQKTSSTGSNFNYSSFYGIPDSLPTVATENLFNDTELSLKTGFVVSNVSTVREYTLNISQALASPDGMSHSTI